MRRGHTFRFAAETIVAGGAREDFGLPTLIHYTRKRIDKDTAAAVSLMLVHAYCAGAIAFTASAIWSYDGT